MRRLLIGFLMFAIHNAMAQTDSALYEILKFQSDLTTEYRNPKTSPLKGKKLKHFKKHDFFSPDLMYRVEATLVVSNEANFFQMKTSTQVLKEYRTYGKVVFVLLGKTFEIPVYQSKMLMAVEKCKNFLFFPFTDLTNGKLTYAAGRYIELAIPMSGNRVIIDFNRAYNPYCAYTDGYSCPVVPADNHLDVEILAGVKYSANH